jgi:nucleoside-diphosphate-sugar epimerase
MKKKIAILGATGHIAKGLLFGWKGAAASELHAFARSADRLTGFLQENGLFPEVHVHPFSDFGAFDADAVINCVGIGNPTRLAEHPEEIFSLTEEYDDLILNYLSAHPAAHYIHFSSGAVYGPDFSTPANDETANAVPVNRLSPAHFYSLAKINSEAKHRARPAFNIVDLRIFGYFSRFTDTGQKYFLNGIIHAIRTRTTLRTGPENFMRDFVHFRDLTACLELCLAQSHINAALDMYSLKPIGKFEVLDFFREHYELDYQVDETSRNTSPTGSKANYYSLSRKAETLIGYHPTMSSLDSLREEAKFLFPALP